MARWGRVRVIAIAVVAVLLAWSTPASALGSWSVQPIPLLPYATADLSGVSCTSASNCEGVGTTGRPGAYEAYATAPYPPPNHDGSPDSALQAVSCVGSGTCMAVGRYVAKSVQQRGLAEQQDQSQPYDEQWQLLSVPSPDNATASELTGVSCTSATSCVAVGSFTNSAGTLKTLAEQWDGAAWTILATPNSPNGAGGSKLVDVSCARSAACIAVGHFVDTAGLDEPFAEQWDGTSWTVLDTAANPGASDGSDLASVSCTAVSQCLAVGRFVNASGVEETLAEQWDGTSWVLLATPNNAKGVGGNRLAGVSCASADGCAAVGRYTTSGGAFRTLAEQWDGTSWTLSTTGNDSGNEPDELTGVACTANPAITCTAMGRVHSPDTGDTWAIVESLSGGTWTTVHTTESTDHSSAKPAGVSCASPSSCVAVGSTPLAWNGKHWTEGIAPAARMEAVSCPSAQMCIAVGENDPGNGALTSQLWDGSTWTQFPMRQGPHSTFGDMDGVSCTSVDDCIAVGWDNAGLYSALAEQWDGTSWTVLPLPILGPAKPRGGTDYNYLFGISCSSSTSCVAVGDYLQINASYAQQPLAEQWDGTAWTQLPDIPTDPNADSTVLASVSCPAANDCTAVGFYGGRHRTYTLAEGWDGTAWSIEPTPALTVNQHDRPGLHSVSCASTTSCVAVGARGDDIRDTDPALTERWDGTTWTLDDPPTPYQGEYLAGVACPSPDTCVVVGDHVVGGEYQPFAQIGGP